MQPEIYYSKRPNSAGVGTRTYQMALFVIFESGLQMLADSPTNYYRERECTEFITQVPTKWDETIALESKVGEYAVVAKRKDDNWYIGGMTNNAEKERIFEVKLDFLDEEGSYTMTFFKNGVNAGRQAMDYKKEVTEVDSAKLIIVKHGEKWRICCCYRKEPLGIHLGKRKTGSDTGNLPYHKLRLIRTIL